MQPAAAYPDQRITYRYLLAAGGEYARLYEIQSCWYQPGYQGGKQA